MWIGNINGESCTVLDFAEAFTTYYKNLYFDIDVKKINNLVNTSLNDKKSRLITF